MDLRYPLPPGVLVGRDVSHLRARAGRRSAVLLLDRSTQRLRRCAAPSLPHGYAATLEIDRSFIHGVPGDADGATITQAVIAMAHSLRLRAIAEGVETVQQLEFLRQHGCDEIQGYFFSRPLPFRELMDMLAAHGSRRGLHVKPPLEVPMWP